MSTQGTIFIKYVKIDIYKPKCYNKCMNEGVVLMLADKHGEANLRTIALALNKSMPGIHPDDAGKGKNVNLLDMVSIGIHNPVSFRTIYELITRHVKPK